MDISPELRRKAEALWGKPIEAPNVPKPKRQAGGSRKAKQRKQEPADRKREAMTSGTNRRLHAAAGRVWGSDAHAELHKSAACLFGRDHTNELSESQAALLLGQLEGRLQRPIEPAPRRLALLRQLEALLSVGGPECEEYVLGTADKRFGSRDPDDWGCGRLSALAKVAQYWLEHSRKK